MIISLGIDIVEIDRIDRAWKRFGRIFAQYILGPEELIKLPERPTAFLATRFAAKEAAAKALGTGFTQQIRFCELQIISDNLGKPELLLSGAAKNRATDLGVTRIHISLTHSRESAVAVVILES